MSIGEFLMAFLQTFSVLHCSFSALFITTVMLQERCYSNRRYIGSDKAVEVEFAIHSFQRNGRADSTGEIVCSTEMIKSGSVIQTVFIKCKLRVNYV